MKKLIVAGIVIILMFASFAAVRFCLEKVPFGFVGVRVHQVSGEIDKVDLQPGYHMVIPIVHKLELMDARKQVVTMPKFTLMAKDENSVGLDITIVYALRQGEAWRARQKYGSGKGFKVSMTNLADKHLIEIMGQLTTEEFFNAERRTEQALAAMDKLNVIMEDQNNREFLKVHNLLIRNVEYNQEFEARLLEKQLFDQEKLYYESKAKTEAELMETQKIEKQTMAAVMAINEEQTKAIEVMKAETDAEIARIDAEAEFHAETVLAEAEREKREKIALGDLEIVMAKAMGEKAINEAYAGLGGQLLLVKKMIDNVSLGQIEINTNRTNPFDVTEMLSMLGAGPEISQKLLEAKKPGEKSASTSFLDELRARIAKDEAEKKAKTEPAAPAAAD